MLHNEPVISGFGDIVLDGDIYGQVDSSGQVPDVKVGANTESFGINFGIKNTKYTLLMRSFNFNVLVKLRIWNTVRKIFKLLLNKPDNVIRYNLINSEILL